MIQNPILRGFHPDPTICRVGEDYYLATSSFSWFPGVPIYHSRNLMNWKRLGYVLNRKEQLHVTYEDLSTGIYAPTLRWHNGVFYLITTNVTTRENFFCTAANPSGPWSDPVVIRDAGGIDPSLFWDDDGKVYFTGTAPQNDPRFDHPMVVCSEIDLTTGQLVGDMWNIGEGAARDAKSPEGPHLYKRDGWYYLLIAEGGTEHNHAVTVSRSRDIHTVFEQCPANPVLTHRHLGYDYAICNVGHADLVECQDGSWYAVCLGSRLINGYHKPLGRETFLVPVVWEDGWPVFSPGTGKVETSYPAPAFAEEEDACSGDDFDTEWNHLGTPYENYVCREGGYITIHMLSKNLVPWEFEGKTFDLFGHVQSIGKTKECMPFYGQRLHEANFIFEVQMDTVLNGRESAGIAIMQNNFHQLRLEGTVAADGQIRFRAMRVTYKDKNKKMHYEETEVGAVILPSVGSCCLQMRSSDNLYDFFVRQAGGDWQTVALQVDGTHLGSETAGGFVGAFVGIFASGNGTESQNKAVFSNIKLKEEQNK